MIPLRRAIVAASLLWVLLGPLAAVAQAPPAVPGLPDTERRTAYSITTSTCVCAVNFAIYGDSNDVDEWIQVWVGGVRKLSTDATYGWSLSSATGPLLTIPRPITDAVLTFNIAQTATIQIVGARRPRRTTQFNENAGVPARALNQSLTDVIAVERELWDKTNDMTGRGLFFAPGNTAGPMPQPSACQGAILGFDATGLNPICQTLMTGSGISVPSSTTPGDNVLFGNSTGTSLIDGGKPLTLTGTNIFTGNQFFGSGKPWCDPFAYGAVANGQVANKAADEAAITSCLTVLANGGTLYLDNGIYCVPDGVTFSISGLQIVGTSWQNGSYLAACNGTAATVTLNASWIYMRDVQIIGKGVYPGDSFGATNPAVQINSSCIQCRLDHVRITGGSPTVENDSGEIQFSFSSITYSYAAELFNSTGGGEYVRVAFDEAWPYGEPAAGQTLPAWSASLSIISTNRVVSMTGPDSKTYFMQAAGNCLTASAQPTVKNYGQTISDGTCTWQLAFPANYALVNINGGSENYFVISDMTGASLFGLNITSSSQLTKCEQCVISQQVETSVNLSMTGNVFITDSSIACQGISTCGGVSTGSSWSGPLTIIGGTISGEYGVLLQGGAYANISNVFINGSVAGLYAAANVSNFAWLGNNMTSGLGATVASGTSDHYIINNNLCGGGSGTISDGGSGTHKIVQASCP